MMTETGPNTDEGNIQGRIEAILFVAGDAVPVRQMAKALGLDVPVVRTVLEKMKDDYDFHQRGFVIKEFGEKVQLATRPLYADDVVRLLQPVRRHLVEDFLPHGRHRVNIDLLPGVFLRQLQLH